jgi:hypothetical protein
MRGMTGRLGEGLGRVVVEYLPPHLGHRVGVLLGRGGSNLDVGSGVISKVLMVNCIVRGDSAGLVGGRDESTISLME